jgi:phage-related protein (TIGR01555 family)
MSLWRKVIDSIRRNRPVTPPAQTKEKRGLKRALAKMRAPKLIPMPMFAPEIMAGVVPKGSTAGIAMDSNIASFPTVSLQGSYYGAAIGFPGFPYLAALTTRAEFRQMATSFSTEMTREWIQLTSSETDGDATKKKITELTTAIQALGLKDVIRTAIEHDCFYGRAQVFVNIKGHDPATPLVVTEKTIEKGSTFSIKAIEAMWTTPATYNASDPTRADFYKPPTWFMLGKQVDATRLRTVVTRPVSDMLKPAFNFAGMSLSQLAEPYVQNWLRTRQSVSDLISNFSILVLKTAMEQVLQNEDDGDDLFDRAALFTEGRDNQALMLVDKEREELEQLSVPLAGLDKLQAQAQEHMCAVTRLPAIILTGISPTGLNASSDGEIRVFYDWIAAQQELWRDLITTIINILQLTMYGAIDPDISFVFVPLFQMTDKELSEVRTANATAGTAYINSGVLSAAEERERLARDPESGYEGLSLEPADLPIPPSEGNEKGDDENEDDEA